MNITPELADKIIDLWRRDAKVFGNQEILCGIYFPYYGRVRVFVAEHCFYANDALWDGKFNLAKKYLVKYGFMKKPKSKSGEKNPQRRDISPIGPGKRVFPKHDWKYVK